MKMVEEGIKVMTDLGALRCLQSLPGASFGAFDPAVWEAFGEWLIRAKIYPSPKGDDGDVEALMAICRDGSRLWTNRFRTPPGA